MWDDHDERTLRETLLDEMLELVNGGMPIVDAYEGRADRSTIQAHVTRLKAAGRRDARQIVVCQEATLPSAAMIHHARVQQRNFLDALSE